VARVLLIAFDGVQTLDVTGPAEVFAAASRAEGSILYRLELASVGGGMRETSASLRIETRDLRGVRPRRDDIVVVAGGDDDAIRLAMGDDELLAWLRRARAVARVTASVCSGAFLLAAAGILDDHRAATHWSACDRLARAFPRVTVDPDAIFVRDGTLWTSAGVTTGIDMALAIVEEDHGRALADAIAARLVLYVRRPGFQSQFSDALVAQTKQDGQLGAAIAWARANLARADVEGLAKRAALSVRTLHRRCLETLGTTPARLIDRIRVEHARALLEASEIPAKQLAVDCGFGSTARMNRAFARVLGITPGAYRVLHASR
jgi:transcriptional regulator GlxA family with amidase domain